MVNKVWLWLMAAATAVFGVVLLILTGRRKTPSALQPPPPAPVDKPIVVLKPADDYQDQKSPALGPPDAVIARINSRHTPDNQ